MTTRAETAGWSPHRAFWFFAIGADLVLLFFLAKITWIALGLVLLAVAVGFVRRVEWLLAFLLLGMPLLAPLRLDEDPYTLILMVLRILYVGGWWFALGRASEGLQRTVARVLRDPITWMVILLSLLLWIGLGWTDAPRYGKSKTIAIFLGNTFLFLAPFLLWCHWRAGQHLDRFLRAAILLGAIFAAFGVASALGMAEQLSFGALVRVQLVTKERLAWLGVSQIWTARLLALWIILVLWGAERRVLRPLIAGAFVLLGLLLIARTGSRGPLAALFLCPVALLLLPRARRLAADARRMAAVRRAAGVPHGRWGRLLRRAVPVGLLAGFLVWISLPEDYRTPLVSGLMRGPIGIALTQTDLGGGISEAVGVRLAQDPSTVYRMHIAHRTLDTLGEVLPWGAGTGGFAALLFLRDFRIYPHNIFAELLFDNGWPGLICFLLFLLLVWRAAWRLSKRNHAGRWLFVLFMMALLNAQVSGDVGTNEWIWFWAGMIGGMAVAAELPRRNPTGATRSI